MKEREAARDDPKKVIILGTGGNSIDIRDTIDEINASRACLQVPGYEHAGFLDDNREIWGTEVCGARVLGPLDSALHYEDCYFVNGIGSPANFWRKQQILSRTGLPLGRFLTLIHPSASVSNRAELGLGTVILQNVTVSSNARIGHQVIVLPNTVLSHHSIIGDYTCIAGGVCVSGGVRVGRACYLGSNCALMENISVGAESLVGMGSVVLTDIPDNSVFAGNPARFLRNTRRA